jgi:hypothetical protein
VQHIRQVSAGDSVIASAEMRGSLALSATFPPAEILAEAQSLVWRGSKSILPGYNALLQPCHGANFGTTYYNGYTRRS